MVECPKCGSKEFNLEREELRGIGQKEGIWITYLFCLNPECDKFEQKQTI